MVCRAGCENGRVRVPGPMIALPRPGRLLTDVRSRTSGSPLQIDRVAAILDRYGLVAVTARNASAVSRNPVIAVTTTGGRRVIVKRYPDRWERDTIVHEHSILRRLEELRFPAVRAIADENGETWVEQSDGGRFVLFEHVDGRDFSGSFLSPSLRVRLMGSAAELLASLHSGLDGFDPDGRHHLTRMTGEGRADTTWAIRALDELGSGSAGGHPSVSWLLDDRDRIRLALEVAADRLDGASLTSTVIHGDYGVHNLIVPSVDAPVVHDFELARVEWRLVDLALTLARLRPPSAVVFSQAFREAGGFSNEEWALFPTVWSHYHLTGAVQSMQNFVRHGGSSRIDGARKRHRLAFTPPEWMAQWPTV